MSTTTAPRIAAPTTPRRGRRIAAWAVQVLLAGQFAAGGALKVTGDPAMVDMFEQIGAGQWLLVVIGALEIAAALGLLIPRLVRPAATGLVALMVGATVPNVAVLHTSPALPLTFGVLAGIVLALRSTTR